MRNQAAPRRHPARDGEAPSSFGYATSLRTPFALLLWALVPICVVALLWSAGGGAVHEDLSVPLLALTGVLPAVGGLAQLAWQRATIRDATARLLGHTLVTGVPGGLLAWLATSVTLRVPPVARRLEEQGPGIVGALTGPAEIVVGAIVVPVVVVGSVIVLACVIFLPLLSVRHPEVFVAGARTSLASFDLDDPDQVELHRTHRRLLVRQARTAAAFISVGILALGSVVLATGQEDLGLPEAWGEAVRSAATSAAFPLVVAVLLVLGLMLITQRRLRASARRARFGDETIVPWSAG